MNIKVKYHNPKCTIERHGSWIDVKSAVNITYPAGISFLIPLGFSCKLPDGYEAHLLPRSSTFKRYGIIMTNSLGVVDSAYSGDEDEWKFPAYSLREGKISVGDRIAQFRIVKEMPEVSVESVDHLDGENRGGFGSTGK